MKSPTTSEQSGPPIGSRGIPAFHRRNAALGAERLFLNGFIFWPNEVSEEALLRPVFVHGSKVAWILYQTRIRCSLYIVGRRDCALVGRADN